MMAMANSRVARASVKLGMNRTFLFRALPAGGPKRVVHEQGSKPFKAWKRGYLQQRAAKRGHNKQHADRHVGTEKHEITVGAAKIENTELPDEVHCNDCQN